MTGAYPLALRAPAPRAGTMARGAPAGVGRRYRARWGPMAHGGRGRRGGQWERTAGQAVAV